MISIMQGTILEKQPPELILNVNGIGYEIFVPMTTFYELPKEGEAVCLYIQQIIREDAHLLFGFIDKLSRHVFRSLIKVNGIGPKVANAILSAMDAATFITCIQEQDIAKLTKTPGIGKKTAERILLDLRDKLVDQVSPKLSKVAGDGVEFLGEHRIHEEAIAALIALGYKPQEATKAVSHFKNNGLNSQELIRKALQNMVS